MGHFVVSTTKLEREDGLKIFSFEEDIAFESIAEVYGVSQGSRLYNIVDFGGENETKILNHEKLAYRFFKRTAFQDLTNIRIARG